MTLQSLNQMVCLLAQLHFNGLRASVQHSQVAIHIAQVICRDLPPDMGAHADLQDEAAVTTALVAALGKIRFENRSPGG